MKKIRLAILGCGSIALEHINALKRIRGAEVYAVASRDKLRRERAAKLAGAQRAERGCCEVLKDNRVDAVVLCTPTHTHYQFSRKIIRAGKHLLLEKPMTVSLRESRQLVQMAGRRGLCLMAAQTQRFLPAYARCRQRIREGRIGRPLLWTARWMEDRRTPKNWKGKPIDMSRDLGDSLIYHHGAHTVDFALWTLDDAVQSICTAATTAEIATANDSDFSILLRMRSGCVVSLTHSFTSRVKDSSVIIVGEKGTLRIVEHRRLEENGRTLVDGSFDQHLAEGIRKQDAEFIRSIRKGVPSVASGEEVLKSMAVLAEAVRQARRG